MNRRLEASQPGSVVDIRSAGGRIIGSADNFKYWYRVNDGTDHTADEKENLVNLIAAAQLYLSFIEKSEVLCATQP